MTHLTLFKKKKKTLRRQKNTESVLASGVHAFRRDSNGGQRVQPSDRRHIRWGGLAEPKRAHPRLQRPLVDFAQELASLSGRLRSKRVRHHDLLPGPIWTGDWHRRIRRYSYGISAHGRWRCSSNGRDNHPTPLQCWVHPCRPGLSPRPLRNSLPHAGQCA